MKQINYNQMKFYVIGIDDCSSPEFSLKIQNVISGGRVFSGGARHREIVKSSLPEGYIWINIVPPMDTLFQQYDKYDEVVVFASGDPLFYGFGSTIQRIKPMAEIVVYPHFNSLQLLSHRAMIPYHDMSVVSLTGRDWICFDESLILGKPLIGILTDNSKHTPRKIAQRMLDYGYVNYDIIVGELLGNEQDENSYTLSVEEVAFRDFRYPNNLIMRKKSSRKRYFGIPDSEFMHLDGRSKMITKVAVRLALLSQLDLRDSDVFWDIGFCTGSVSIEAKIQFPHLKVISFEQREQCREIIEYNIKKFGAVGIEYHIGDFLEQDISELPRPNSVFIGGHGGKLKEIVAKVVPLIESGGVMLFNSVSQESLILFESAASSNGLRIADRIKLKVDDNNSINIIKAVK